MDRRSVDTGFGIAFIVIAVVVFYPAVYMFLFETFGPTPPVSGDQLAALDEAERMHLSKSPEGMTFMGLTVGWFIAGAVIPFGVAITTLQTARRLFRQSRPGILKVAALLSVPALYGAFSLFSLYM